MAKQQPTMVLHVTNAVTGEEGFLKKIVEDEDGFLEYFLVKSPETAFHYGMANRDDKKHILNIHIHALEEIRGQTVTETMVYAPTVMSIGSYDSYLRRMKESR